MPKILSRLLLSLLMALTVSSYVSASEIPSNAPILKVDHYNVPEGLSQSSVTSIVEDQQGHIWIGTLNGLNRFDGIHFKHYFTQGNDSSLPSSFIRSLFVDTSGKLYIGTDKGLSIYNHELNSFYSPKFGDIENDLPIWSITANEGKIIIGSENQVLLLNKELKKENSYIIKNAEGIKNVIATSKEIYARTYHGDVYRLKDSATDKILQKVQNIIKTKENVYAIKHNKILDITKGNEEKYRFDENIDLGFNDENQMLVFSKARLYKESDNFHKPLSLENNNFNYTDAYKLKNSIILTAPNNGLSIINEYKNLIKEYKIDKNIWSANKYNNQLIVTSDAGNIKVLDRELNELKKYEIDIKGPKSAIIKNDKLLVASQQGLVSINLENNKLTVIDNSQYFMIKDVIDSPTVLAGSTGGELVRYDTISGILEKLTVDKGNPVFDININENNIWVATQGGLFKVKDNNITNIYNEDLVVSIYSDKNEVLFGTRTSLYKYNLVNGETKKIIHKNKPIYAIATYKNLIIAPSNSEIIIYDRDSENILTLSSAFGSQEEYNVQAISVIDSNIYIGGIDGLSVISMKKLENLLSERNRPSVILDDLLVFNIPQKIGEGVLSKSISYSESIQLKYSDYPFTLGFSTPGNQNSDLQYSYQMEGLSDVWINSKGINSATYTNLSPGPYVFKVHAIDPLTEKFGPTKSIAIEITPPWWLSIQAKLVYLLITLLITGAIGKAALRRREVQRQIAKSEERLKLSLWGSGDEMWDWDIETGQIYRSNIWGSLEFPRDGQRSGEEGEESNIHPMDQERVNTALNKHFYGETDHFEAAYRVKGKDDQWIWILDRAKIVERDEEDKALRMTGTIKNISNFKQAEEQLRLFERAIENISEGMFILDNKFKFVEVNEACCDLCEKSRNDFIGELFKFDLYPESYSEQIRHILQQQGSWSNEVESAKGDGSSFLMELTVDAIYDEQGVLSHYVGVFSDISRRKQQEEELRKLTNNDLLTSLPNRSSLMVTLGNLVKKDTHHTLMVLDLDNFKKINDSLGHQVGDELLIKVARRIESTVPYHTSIYRLGGDEFAILVDNNPDIGSSAVIANHVVDAFSSPFELTKDRVVVGVSIGIVLYPEDDQNEQALLRKADIAMYHAKSAGGNRYQFYSESLNRNAIRQLEVENLIREGLRDDLFEVYYQPKIDLRTSKMAGMEALVRLNHPEHGLISPGDFIPLAEENGLIVEIGEVVLRKACFAAQNWRRQNLFNGRVAVNLSSQQFALPDLQQRIESILRLTQLPAANLELEITEGTVIKQPEKAIKVMMQLSKMGVSLALDDFGTGYSSLSYLKRFPIDTLKIDKAFVDDIDKSDRDLKMVDSIITIAHNMGLSVVGEGVEEASQLSILKALKCEEIQGFIYSKAVNESSFTELLKQESFTSTPVSQHKKA
ncbi:EAL domain-containing protein [Shewanella alkalitolerans]|uniref:EAL domain-containing protein n=1 Tax=Shewanella alkalitolerans TaxID=2864209 RepID=UPI001C65E910|nr:EAL domain-containing protein [Shewanella alkalitolerans]QYJ96360.1 EAL domain-containing protein [Shewanella alkalitolerans]